MRRIIVRALRSLDAYLFASRIPTSHFGGSDRQGNYGWPLEHREPFHAHNRWLDRVASRLRRWAWRLEA